MGAPSKELRPNRHLRVERERRGWSQRRVAEEISTNVDTVSKWERGINVPDPYFREKLCTLFGRDAIELGFVDQEVTSEGPSASLATATQWTIPLPPSAYLAHPYPLQENFTGRNSERQMLTEWLTNDPRAVFSLVALGGMGKSSLTWTWLQEDVMQLPEPLRPHGVLWWSFYEAEAYFVTFLNHALTYVSGGTIDPTYISSTYEKMQSLLSLLQQRRFLVIFDGFERQLRAYSGFDSASHNDGITDKAQKPFRVCVDPHVGSFLRWAAAGNLQSKILLSSRLPPQELDGLVGCRHERLHALHTEDAITFLRAQGVQGTRAEIQAACTFYGNHPLTLRLLAGVVAYDPARPGDIAVATEYNLLPEIAQREHHILAFVYDALHPPLRELLSQLAAFRSSVDFKTVKDVSTFADERMLKEALRELIERGFIFFDRTRGRYDLHPIVRQYSYARLQRKEEVHTRLADYFQSMMTSDVSNEPIEKLKKIRVLFTGLALENDQRIKSVEDLTPTIELFHHLVLARDFEKAFRLYYHHLAVPLYHQLNAYQIVIELLQSFFSNDEILFPSMESSQQSWLLDALANAYSASGYPLRAVQLLKKSIQIDQGLNDKESLATTMWNVAVQQLELGELAASERSLQKSISICQII
jgi:transcriptional regulator with XRE-family HTH domain